MWRLGRSLSMNAIRHRLSMAYLDSSRNLSHTRPVDTESLADFAVAHALLE
jgi:hypothetical protein